VSAQRLASLSGRDFYLNWRTKQTVAPIEDRPDAPKHNKRVRGIPMPGDWNDYFLPDFPRASRQMLEDARTIVHEPSLSRSAEGDINFVSSHWILLFDDEPRVDSLRRDRVTPEQAALVREIVPYATRIRPSVRLAGLIESFSDEFDIDRATVGVHIRLNHPGACQTGPDRYFFAIDAALASCRNIFLATDNDRAEQELRKRYGRLLIFNPKRSRIREEPDAMDDAVIDLMLLSRVGALVRNHASTFGDAAWWIGGCSAVNHVISNNPDSVQRLTRQFSGWTPPPVPVEAFSYAPAVSPVPVVGSILMRIGCSCDLRTDSCSPVHPDMPTIPLELANLVLDQTDPLTRLVVTGSAAGSWLNGSGSILKRVVEENRTLDVVSSGVGLRGCRLLREALASSRVSLSVVAAGSWEQHETLWGIGSWDEYVRCLREYGKAIRALPEGAGRVCASFHLTEATAIYLEGFLKTCSEAGVPELQLLRPQPPGKVMDGDASERLDEAVALAIDYALMEGLTLRYPAPVELLGSVREYVLNDRSAPIEEGRVDLDSTVSLVRDCTELEILCDGMVARLNPDGTSGSLGALASGLSVLYRQACLPLTTGHDSWIVQE
jgi:hypothetical protein